MSRPGRDFLGVPYPDTGTVGTSREGEDRSLRSVPSPAGPVTLLYPCVQSSPATHLLRPSYVRREVESTGNTS